MLDFLAYGCSYLTKVKTTHRPTGRQKGGESMSEKEKQAAKELIDSLKQIPPDGADYVRGYLQGRLDGIKAEKKEDKE